MVPIDQSASGVHRIHPATFSTGWDLSPHRFARVGVVGFWTVRPGAPVEAQPVVFSGSGGERVVRARDLASLPWLPADDTGPRDAALFAEFGELADELVDASAIPETGRSAHGRPGRSALRSRHR
ncbi:hypothetical protein [Kineococcus arenarius]|uniref:hypothetical protein n=1 Tax=Kineococcus sp. SYSU DK007 TaxID=3383128 RepID=UPI003D7EB966